MLLLYPLGMVSIVTVVAEMLFSSWLEKGHLALQGCDVKPPVESSVRLYIPKGEEYSHK